MDGRWPFGGRECFAGFPFSLMAFAYHPIVLTAFQKILAGRGEFGYKAQILFVPFV